jgi:hypothetical protein
MSGRSLITECTLPPGTLLERYCGKGAYVDCLECQVRHAVNLEQLVVAFYNSRAFRPERWAIGALLGLPATNADVVKLAAGRAQRFSAWTVEARTDNQIMMCDYQGRTRSWLMVEAHGAETTLRFGSAVLAQHRWFERLLFKALTGFHRHYSRRLLESALAGLGNLGFATSG